MKISDSWNAYIRANHDKPQDWQWKSVSSCEEDVPHGMWKFTGAVYPILKAGPNKGKPNYKQPIGGLQTVFVDKRKCKAWVKEHCDVADS